MKLKELEVGREYSVKVPERLDVDAFYRFRFLRESVWATVLEVGVYFDVPEYITYGGIQGTPRVISGYHRSERPDGVRVRLDNGNEVVLRASSFDYERPDWTRDEQ